MATATFSVRMDKDLKKNFSLICSSIGLNVSSAINVFATAMVNQKKLPFELISNIVDDNNISHIADLIKQDAMYSKASDMSLREINNEIRSVRKWKRK